MSPSPGSGKASVLPRKSRGTYHSWRRTPPAAVSTAAESGLDCRDRPRTGQRRGAARIADGRLIRVGRTRKLFHSHHHGIALRIGDVKEGREAGGITVDGQRLPGCILRPRGVEVDDPRHMVFHKTSSLRAERRRSTVNAAPGSTRHSGSSSKWRDGQEAGGPAPGAGGRGGSAQM